MDQIKRLGYAALVLATPGTALLIYLPLYIVSMGGTPEHVALTTSLGPAVMALMRLASGTMSEFLGRVKTFILGVLIYISGLAGLALAYNTTTVFFAAMLVGVGAAMALTSAMTMVADLGGEPWMFGTLSSNLSLGGVLGSIVAFIFAFLYPPPLCYKYSFAAYTVLASFSIVIIRGMKETRRKTRGKLRVRRSWYIATLMGSLVSAISGIVMTFYPLLLKEKFVLGTQNILLSYAPAAIAAIIAPRIAGRMKPVNSLLLFSILIGVSTIIIPSTNDPIHAAIALGGVVGGVGGCNVPIDTIIARSCIAYCGIAIGLYSAITQLITSVSTIAGGALYTNFGYWAAYALSTLLSILLIMLSIIYAISELYRESQKKTRS